MKRTYLYITIFFTGILLGPLINPFSILKEYFEEDAISHVIGEAETYNGEKVIEVDYIGEDFYSVKTEANEYIFEQSNTSFMNGVWVIYEKIEEGYNW